jgi:hypoxanthine phosphoribosyltransferase
MKIVKILDKQFELYINNNDILKATQDIADRINNDYPGRNPVFLVILNGAFMFASELLKRINISCDVSFVKLASYSGTESSGTVRKLIGIDEDLDGRDVLIIEDIVDSGISIDNIINDIKPANPAEIKIASLLFKPKSFTKDFSIDYLGMEISDVFIVGFGLDYNGKGRNFKHIYKEIS